MNKLPSPNLYFHFPSPPRLIERLARGLNLSLLALAFVALLFLFLVYLIYAAALFRFPFDYDQGEGFELWDAVLFGRGQWIYLDNETYPFYSSNYAPLFPLLLAPLVKIFGPKLWVGRVFSFATTLVIGATIFWIVRRETQDKAIAALAGLSFFAANIVYQIGPLCRLHMLMVMLGLLGVALMARLEDARHGRRYLWLALLCLLAAGYTKQLAFDAVAAAFLFFFLRRPRQALVYGVGFAVVVGLIFWLINLATDGQWFFNAITANANPFIPGQTETLFKQWFRLYKVLILLAAGYVAWTLYLDRISVYSLYFVIATAKGVLSGKWGAGPAYFSTSIVAACICAGIGLGLLRRRVEENATQNSKLEPRNPKPAWQWTHLALGVIVPLLFLYQAKLNLHLPLDHPLTRPVARLLDVPETSPHRFRQDYYDSMGYTQLGHLPTDEDIANGWRIVDWVKNTPGPAWSEEAMFEIWAGKEVVTNPTQLFNLDRQNKLDMSEMIETIYQRPFGVVIFRAQFYPPPVLEAIGQNYEPVEHISMNGFLYAVLRPKLGVGGSNE